MFGLSALAIKAILFAAAAAVVLAGASAFVIHQRHAGRDAAIAQMTKETAAETERRRAVVEEQFKIAEAAATKLQITEAHNAALLQQIEALSARNDATGCLDADSVRRLQELDRR